MGLISDQVTKILHATGVAPPRKKKRKLKKECRAMLSITEAAHHMWLLSTRSKASSVEMHFQE